MYLMRWKWDEKKKRNRSLNAKTASGKWTLEASDAHVRTVAVIILFEINDIIGVIIDKNFLPLAHETPQ